MNMRPIALAPLVLLLPLAACASNDTAGTVSNTSTEDAVAARLPEVRYYVIADT